MTEEAALDQYLRDNSNHERADEILRYYQCDIAHCPMRRQMFTKLQLVDHFYKFHYKLTLARWHAMVVAKEQDQRRLARND